MVLISKIQNLVILYLRNKIKKQLSGIFDNLILFLCLAKISISL